MATVLVLGGVAVGATQFGGDAEAQGAWEMQTWEKVPGRDGLLLNVNALPADPDRFFDDWIRTLPSNCDVGPVVALGDDIGVTYRCPG